jgi:NADH:flavin oxidoreductase / NADH oxidase family
VILARRLKELGIDLIDVSSGALTPKARIPIGKGYQVPFARRIRDEAKIMTGAVGLITEAAHSNEIITGGDADVVFTAREMLREPYWALKAQSELGAEPSWPVPYGYAVKRSNQMKEEGSNHHCPVLILSSFILSPSSFPLLRRHPFLDALRVSTIPERLSRPPTFSAKSLTSGSTS